MACMESEKFIMFKKIRNWFLFSLIPASIGAIATLWINSNSSEIPYFDKIITVETSIISKQDLLNHDVKILVDGKEVEKISKLNISLLNFSNKSYPNVKVSVTLNSEKNVQVISENALDENDKKLLDEEKIKLDNTFIFNVPIVKRTDTFKKFFTMTIFYKGDYKFSLDDVIITIPNAEPKIRDYSAEHRPNYLFEIIKVVALIIFGSIFGIVGFSLFVVVVLFLISYLFRNADIKANKKYAKRLFIITEGISVFDNIDDTKRKEIIVDLLYQNRMEIWGEMNWLMRLLEANSEPKKSNYNFL